MKNLILEIAGVAAMGIGLWTTSAPPSYHEPAGPRHIGPLPETLLQADIGDVIKSDLVAIAPELPGHDEILPLPGTSKVLVSARDEWVWLADTATGSAEKFAYSPVSPTGAHLVPGNGRPMQFCNDLDVSPDGRSSQPSGNGNSKLPYKSCTPARFESRPLRHALGQPGRRSSKSALT